ncbi:probable G-protein coupled receptor 156 [Aplysia californica]|uniref:Probable G-protein coupled receptor 156 n=1 Tax=Aplysia californica TaxID=6500 RepID=A0ABM0JH36_APLCA|nr:probable G-protein coupled receptor 156 [Aplysia californica]
MLKDSSLCVIIVALALVNCCVLIAWFLVSPQTPHLIDIGTPVASSDKDLMYQEQFLKCDSKYGLHFTVALIAIQGVVILFGAFLAIQTRKVSLPQLNESKWIALCIYNVVVLSPVGVVVVMATDSKPEMSYSLEAAILILVTAVTEFLIFVPKIIAYRRFNRSKSPKFDLKLKLRNINNVLGIFGVPSPPLDPTDQPKSLHTDGQAVSLDPTTANSTRSAVKCPGPAICLARCSSGMSGDTDWPDTPTRAVCAIKDGATKNELPLLQFQEFLGSSCDSSRSCYIGRSRSDSNLSSSCGDQKTTSFSGMSSSIGDKMDAIDSDFRTVMAASDENASELTVKVKADVKMKSKIGFKASWKEGRTGVPQNEQVLLLLNRLRDAVNTEHTNTKC